MINNRCKASVIIPVFNQCESLKKVIYGFSLQNISKENFEIIVIDDGSTDGLCEDTFVRELYRMNVDMRILHQGNKGRAAARNNGILESKGDILIFCDGDRVPANDFVIQHLKLHENRICLALGNAYDYFGRAEYISLTGINWERVEKLSRLSNYYKKVQGLYDEDGNSTSELVWLSFLVGNSSINREIVETGLFNEQFREWGFEHFEFAYRKYLEKFDFRYSSKLKSYHIPHARPDLFYLNHIKKNAHLLHDLHPEINEEAVIEFVYGNVPVEKLQDVITGDKNKYSEN